DIQGGRLGNEKSKTHLVGNYVYIDADSAKLNSNVINVTAIEDGYIQRQMINFAKDDYEFKVDEIVKAVDYQYHEGKSNFKKALTIGNMGNEKDNAIEWWHFAKGWNEDLGDIRNIDEFRLVGNIDFSGNQGKGVEGKDWQNYANYWVDLNGDGVKQDNEFTSMIVGNGGKFAKTFDGQGYTLKNINIDIDELNYNKILNVGIFGDITDGASFKNINVDYMGGGIKYDSSVSNNVYIGGFIGRTWLSSDVCNITLKNISKIDINGKGGHYIGGFAGAFGGKISNVYVENINSIKSTLSSGNENFTGGFTGILYEGVYTDIIVKNITNISQYNKFSNYVMAETSIGGFAALAYEGVLDNIFVNVGDIYMDQYPDRGYIGGFIGQQLISSDSSNIFNIKLEIGSIQSDKARIGGQGGFIGTITALDDYNGLPIYFKNIAIEINKGIFNPYSFGAFIGEINPDPRFGKNGKISIDFSNINIYFNETPNSQLTGKFFEKLNDRAEYTFNNIHIYHHENDLTNATNDQAYWNDFNKNGYVSDKINIHTYNNSTQNGAYEEFLSRANTIEKPTPPTNPDNPNDSDVVLGSDDLYEDVLEKIITSIKNSYIININDKEKLKQILQAYKAYKDINNDNKEEKAKFLSLFLYSMLEDTNVIDKEEFMQSIDFLLAYKDNGILNENNEHRFDDISALKDIRKIINEQLDKLENDKGLEHFMSELETLVKNANEQKKEYDKFIKDQDYFNKLNSWMKDYESIVNDLENKDMSIQEQMEKIAKLEQLKKDILDLYQQTNEKYELANNAIGKFNTLKDKANKQDNFKLLGGFIISGTLPNPNNSLVDIDKINIKDPIDKPDIPDKPIDPIEPPIDNKPDFSLSFEQSSTFNSIGDEAIDDEEEQEEIEEASLNQKNKA
nr:hypothetical protein [Campylobacter lari]